MRVQVDAHSELMGQYPWGFDGVVPNASDNAPDTGAYAGGRLVFRDTGQLPGEAAPHSYTAMVGSDRDPVRGAVGPGHYGPNGMGRKCARPRTPAPMPKRVRRRPVRQGHRRPAALPRSSCAAARPRDAVDRRRRLGRLAGRRARRAATG